MCGIAGIIGPHEPASLRQMCAQLKHRGPDDAGLYHNPEAQVGLGMVRLSVIDLAGGHQPMSSADQQLHIVFNGEIYNYRELRAELEQQGTTFRTQSDTEVIIALYARHGRDCVRSLRGMFAFAMWDGRRQELLLARDRLGVKPLYYAQQGAQLAFASELKALLTLPWISRELDPRALAQYLALLYVPAPRAILRDVEKLPAGSTAIHARGQLRIDSYWNAADVVAHAPRHASSPEALREQLIDAVHSRLVSDVPVGVFLSGGLDSSAIVAAIRQRQGETVRTFALGFEPPYEAFNELPAARLIAEHYETDHHEFLVRPDVASLLPQMVRHLDEPCGDSSALLTYLVSRETRAYVKVALSGVGGDELFAGYPRYLGAKWAVPYQRVPRIARRLIARAAQGIQESTTSRNVAGWIRRFLMAGDANVCETYIRWMQFMDAEQLEALLPSWQSEVGEALADLPHREIWARMGDSDPLQRILAVDVMTYLSDNLLMLGDRMSMAHGLELREPLCDHRLLEFVAGVASSTRLPGHALKGWMKQAIAPWLPPAVLHRPKQGFMLPLGDWLRGPLKPLAQDLLSPARLRRRGWVQADAVEHLLHEHLTGTHIHTHQLWSLMILELWADTVLAPS